MRPEHSIGRLQRAIARNLAILLQRPTWHLCWALVAARSPADTALSLAYHRRRSFVLVRSGSFMNNAESWVPAAVLTSRRGRGRKSVRFRVRF